jgi:WD40 repeat protein
MSDLQRPTSAAGPADRPLLRGQRQQEQAQPVRAGQSEAESLPPCPGPSSPDDRLAWLAHVRAHQDRRWRRGERVPAERYLARLPGLAADAEAALDLIFSEFLLREALGEAPHPEEYLARFPAHAEPLRRQFELLRALQSGGADADPADTPGPAVEAATLPPAAPGPERTTDSPAGEAADLYATRDTPRLGPAPAEGPPAVPGYEVLGELGRGGMGVVYRARQTGLGRTVALKMILAGGHAGAQDRARFKAEAEAIARLQHPNIVQVHEVGEHGGLPFFSLEFCPGGSLAQKLRGDPLPAREAARLVELLAGAVQAAHAAQVVHRDLKPANVLLAADGTPKVTDFGLAKRLDEAGQTASGAVMGTPSYMAPEQAAGQTRQVGPAADVYALGAILYELVTDRPPFKAASSLDTILQVIGDEPVPPSRLNRGVSRDLETICLTCLHKEPARRYASARALAEDLRAFQESRPIRARPVGGLGRAWRWCRRNPAVAGLLAAVAGSLLLGAAVAAYFAVRAEARAEAEKEARHLAELKEEEANSQRDEARRRGEETRRVLYGATMNLIQREYEANNIAHVRHLLAQLASRPPGAEDLRGFEWHYWNKLAHRELRVLPGHTGGGTFSVAWGPGGRRLASAGVDGTVRVWDAARGRELLALKPGYWCVAWSPDGKRLANGGLDGTVRIWDAATGREVLALKGHTGSVPSVTWSPDGKRLASGGRDGTVRIWDAAGGRELLTFGGHKGGVISVAFSPDGRRLASAGNLDLTVRLWDAARGQELLALKAWAGSVAFSPDGLTLASACRDNAIRQWDAADGRELLALKAPALNVAWSPDGKRLASAGSDSTVRVWDPRTGQVILTFKGHTGAVCGVAWSSDGRRLASAGGDNTVRIWDAAGGREVVTLKGHTLLGNAVAWGPDGRRLASVGFDGIVRVWDAAGGRELLALKGHPNEARSVAWRHDGKRLASAGQDGTVRVWDVASGREVFALKGHTGGAHSVAWSADGRRLASAGSDNAVRVWDARTGREVLALRGHTGSVQSVAWSPDGKRLASAGEDAMARLRDTADGRELLVFKGAAFSVAWGPGGRRLASGGLDSTVRVWDAASGRKLLALRGHTRHVWSVAWSPDGRRLASASADGTLRIWDATGGRELLALKGHPNGARSVAWSPDGNRLALAGGDGLVRVWYAAGSRELLTLKGI